MRRALLLVLSLVAGVLSTFAVAGPAAAVDYDCSDFSTQSQAQAQKVYVDAGGPAKDPYRLDADHDGNACDSLPCPCGYSGSSGSTTTGTASTRVRQLARVTRVVDGDTVDVRLRSGADRRVRLIGIDTPEVYGGTKCGGPAASRSLKRMLPVGTRVRLVSDPTQARVDRYGRLLRYVVRRSDGKDVDRAQVWCGWARVYVYGGDPFERVRSYRRARSEAKAAPRGIWRSC